MKQFLKKMATTAFWCVYSLMIIFALFDFYQDKYVAPLFKEKMLVGCLSYFSNYCINQLHAEIYFENELIFFSFSDNYYY